MVSCSGTYDAVVIGAGVIGSASALELRREGFSVLCVDAGPQPGYGSTSYSSSIVRVFYSATEPCRLAWEGLHAWRQFQDYVEAGKSEELAFLREIGTGILDAPRSPASQTFLSRVKATMAQQEIPTEYWDLAELQRRVPGISGRSYYPPRRIDDEKFGEDNGSELAGFLWLPGGYVNDPQLAAKNIADAAMRKGAEFRFRSPVKAIQCNPQGDRVQGVVFEDGSRVEAPIVVNAAGPHSAAVHKLAFANAKVADDSKVHSRPLRVEVAYLQEPAGADFDANMPVMTDMDVGIYMRPQQGGQLLVGSVEPECDSLEYLDSADGFHTEVSEEWTNYVYRACLRFPELGIPSTAQGLAALYDPTPDWTPIYDRSALGGFYSMRGTSGNQFKNAVVAGRILARLVDGCENGRDHDAEALRLPFQHTRGELDLGTFSRLRDAGASSGTVLG